MKATLHLHSSFNVGAVDPRVFGGFLEHLGRAVYEGIYDPESPKADEHGCRTDVLDSLRRLRFTAMRYPGGNFVSGYHWEDAVGPRESRPRTRDLAWKSIETNQFGPNEFVELCNRMDWIPMLAVNLGTGTPLEARNWAEYCNLESGSKWADLRIEHGYRKPHNVKLWCMGNEMDGPWQIGHLPAEAYAIKAQQTARMMKMVDPSIEVVVCGSCATNLPTYLEWDRQVLEYCRADADFLSLHRYVGNSQGDTEDYLAVGTSIDRQIEATDSVCLAVHHTQKTKKRTYLCFDEWNVWYRTHGSEFNDGAGKVAPHLLEESYNMEDALVAAQFLNSFIRHADCVKIANLAQIVNVIAPIMTQGNKLLLQTIFYPIEMIANRGKGVSLRTVVDSPRYESKSYGAADIIDASAILSGSALKVFLVNRSVSDEVDVTINLADGELAALESAEIFASNGPTASNTFENPDRVASEEYNECSIVCGSATIKLPAMSVYAATFRIDL